MPYQTPSHAVVLLCGLLFASSSIGAEKPAIDFNRDIRAVLSNNCLTCHGPDENERQAGLRLDERESATGELDSGLRAIVPGQPEQSELVARITSEDPDLRMPPPDAAKQLSPREIELLTDWIRDGAEYAQHWSYVAPIRPDPPEIPTLVAEVARLQPPQRNHIEHIDANAATLAAWPKNEIDRFILDRLLRERFTPSPEADRHAQIRRVSLDLTGLPPTLEEVDQFINDTEPNAYEKLVDRLLMKKTYGEHWARKWLDLARYADSAGYADDPPRTIWAYRDWVIRALNENKPFDRFTIEQIAGDLLPDPSEDQLIATAFHRNTLTNNEGGTNDEEFRNVAVADRVATTMAVWMGTTIGCAQCHHHKYDPISQEDFFRLFAILNNTEDADRRDESPLLEIWTDEQLRQKADWQREIDDLDQIVRRPTPELAAAQTRWESRFSIEPQWRTIQPLSGESREGAELAVQDDGRVIVASPGKTDVYTLRYQVADARTVTALRLEALPHESLPGGGPGFNAGNFVLSSVAADFRPPVETPPAGRYVRVTLPGKKKFLSLAEVQVFAGSKNVATQGEATQISTDYDGPARLAIDGNTNGDYFQAKSTTHTAQADDPWWEVDLKADKPIDRIVVWNRTDSGTHARLANFQIELLDGDRQVVWEQSVAEPPNPSVELSLTGARNLPLAAAFADYSQSGFQPADVIDNSDPASKGWAIGGQTGKPHWLVLTLSEPVTIPAGSELSVTLSQVSRHENHTLGAFRVSATDNAQAATFAQIPSEVLAIVRVSESERTDEQREKLAEFYRGLAPELKPQRDRLEQLKKQLAELKPSTTVPVMRELPDDRRRTTHVQRRGNYLDLGQQVEAGVPATFHPLRSRSRQTLASAASEHAGGQLQDSNPSDDPPPDRLALAHWLIDENNPLTARVIANRYWETVFGQGIVRSSEEFGSQGDLPSHPELLDWLATELVRLNWDMKAFLKLLVTSATYRQSSQVTPELLERDLDNVWLARGPRVRVSAEVIRDQTLAVSGLLSPKMYGPPVKPPQPSLGLSAAFGSGIDWQTSDGEDRYRRGLYTTWRRSNPYPSMAAFDAPNREVCTVRRTRTNTPLQALVTLNDPVYVEAAQALARRIVRGADFQRTEKPETTADKAQFGFRLCLARPASEDEVQQLVGLYDETYEKFSADRDAARRLATNPLGPPPEGADVVELAAWTVVANVLLNLDEMFMKR